MRPQQPNPYHIYVKTSNPFANSIIGLYANGSFTKKGDQMGRVYWDARCTLCKIVALNQKAEDSFLLD